MKKYDDLTARLLERRDRYVADQKQKQQRMLRIALPAGGGLLVALLCVGLWQGGAFDPAELPVEPSEEITTTATTEGGADGDDTVTDPTANPTDPTVNDSTIPSTTVPADIVTDVVSGTDTTTEVTQILTTTGSTHTTADTTVTTVTTTDVTPSDTVIGDSTHTTADTTEDATVPTATVPTDIIPTVNHSTTVDDGTTADKTTSATGKPHSTTTTEQPTTGKTDPTTATIGKPTKNTTGKTKPTTKPTTKTEPTKTTATKTDPTTQTTKIDVSDWPVIVADTPQYVSSDGSLMWYGPKGGYLDYYLKKKMKIHDGEDVLYAVVIEVLLYLEEYNGFWQSTEELAQIDKEYWDAYHAYEEEAKKLNPNYPNEKVSVWSEEMRVKYDLYRSLRDKRQDIEDQQKFDYYRSVINPRVDYLNEVITTEMISIAEDGKYYTAYGYVGFYAELPAETLLQLEAYGDYVVRLVSPEGDLVRND